MVGHREGNDMILNDKSRKYIDKLSNTELVEELIVCASEVAIREITKDENDQYKQWENRMFYVRKKLLNILNINEK
jgi:hypothetical protein